MPRSQEKAADFWIPNTGGKLKNSAAEAAPKVTERIF